MNVLKNHRVVVVILFLMFSLESHACDVCSCGSSNSSSFGSAIPGNYIGILYNYMKFHYNEGVFENSPIAKDHINTLTISGQYQVNDAIQVNILLPYRFNHRYTSVDNVHNNGLGDITLFGTYEFFSKKEEHSLKLGAGLKLPTGNFDLLSSQSNKTSATQLGTGSLDFMIPIQYGYSYEDLSLSLGAVYFMKNKNKEEFKYGNQTQINASVSYSFQLKKGIGLSPMLGVSYDNFLATERFDLVDSRTSGYMTTASLGLEVSIKKLVFGLNSKFPIKQNLIENEVRFKSGVGLYAYKKF